MLARYRVWKRERADARQRRRMRAEDDRYWHGYASGMQELVGSCRADGDFIHVQYMAEGTSGRAQDDLDPFDRGWRDACDDAMVLAGESPGWLRRRRM